MATQLDRSVTEFINDTGVAHAIVQGGPTETVETEGGPVRTFAKLIADNQATFDQAAEDLLQIGSNTGASSVGTVDGSNVQEKLDAVPAIASAAAVADVNAFKSQLSAQNGSILIGFIASVAGAVLRTLQAKAREIVTAADSGGTATPVLIHSVTNAQGNGPNIHLGGIVVPGAISSDISTSVLLNPGSAGYENVIGGNTATVGTTTPNVVQAGTGAHVSLVGGYDTVVAALSSKAISDHSKIEKSTTGQGHNAIFGGATLTITGTASYSFIGGGKDSIVRGYASFATGSLNDVGGNGSFASGAGNTVTSNYGNAMGNAHTVSGANATAIGSINNAVGNFSFAYGNFSYARYPSQLAAAGGRFSVAGDAQSSVLPLYRLTTDATTVTMGYLNSNSTYELLPNSSVAFDLLVVARDTGGNDTAAWRVTGALRRPATGSSVLVGTPTVTLLGADAGAAAWTLTISTSSIGGLLTRVTGEVAKTIRWVGRLTLSEVSY